LALPVVVMTAWGSIELAVQAMREGAADFIEKPWDNTRVLQIVRQQLRVVALQEQNQRWSQLSQESQDCELLGDSAAMRQLREQATRFASADANVLVVGESGTGKSLLARYLHRRSSRHKGPLVSVNMAAVPENLFESELFGHKRGAFTDARGDRVGRFELAGNGSLFLDEIGCLPLALQAKLLRVLESGEYEVLGSSRTKRCDVRVIAASNIDFDQAIAAGRFRQDLYFRLNTIELRMPALRDRRDDIPLLAGHILAAHAQRYRLPPLRLSPAAMARLTAHHWPGNVRELANVLERAALLNAGGAIDANDLQLPDQPCRSPATCAPTESALDIAERQTLQAAMEASGGRASAAARLLGLSRSAMYRRLEKHGIAPGQES
jgi:DNA-binding NtrC family response regulator